LVLLFIDVNAALARWMHRVCADLAGWDEKSDFESAVTNHPTNPPRRGGPPRPPARIDAALLNIDVYVALAGWMHRVCADLAGWDEISI
jgi:phosphatidylethanolamine-binding protein (PEBP) family uncharacterized protein